MRGAATWVGMNDAWQAGIDVSCSVNGQSDGLCDVSEYGRT